MPKTNKNYNCYVCDKEIRSDNLNRHYSTHINELFTASSRKHLEDCIIIKRPILSIQDPKKNYMVAYCLYCNKGAYQGVYNHTPGHFIQYHHIKGCNEHFKDYTHLFKEHIQFKLDNKEKEDIVNNEIEKLKKQLEDAKEELAAVKEELEDTKKELDDSYNFNNTFIEIKHQVKTWYKELNEKCEEWLAKPKTTDRDNLILINYTLDKMENFPLDLAIP
jgi:hypothetical protein